jgi:hypothetical protein
MRRRPCHHRRWRSQAVAARALRAFIMRHLPLSLLCLTVLAGPQRAPDARVAVHVQFRAVSEDETANGGTVTLALGAGEARTAAVWERDCQVAGREGPDAPADADQFWTFQASRTADRPGVRVRYRHVSGPGAPPPEQDVSLSTDGRNPLTLSALSTSTLCRYDRIALAVSATTVR